MSETVQAAIERLENFVEAFKLNPYEKRRARDDDVRTLLADHARLEGENERLRNELDDALHDYGNAESEAKAAEADNEDLKAALTEARREVSELREGLAGFADDYQTSEHHHPDHVLIPKATFERVAALIQRGEQPGGGEEGRIGPRPKGRGVCKGCPAYEAKSWREPSGDGETYDTGQYAWCNASDHRSMGAYHYDFNDAPEWCPALSDGEA